MKKIFMQPLYDLERPMRVAILFSGGASAALSMLDDPNHGKLYMITGAATHNPMASGISKLQPYMQVLTYSSENEYYERNGLNPKQQSSKYKYWDHVIDTLEVFQADAVALSGLFQIVRYPVISEVGVKGERHIGRYADRTLNVHPADLSVLSDGTELIRAGDLNPYAIRNLSGCERKFKGDNAVYDALKAGEQRTQSTVHMATRQIDEGPIVVRSPYVDATGIEPEQYQKLQDFMKTHCDGPAFQKAIALMASGSLAIENSALFLKENNVWQQLPYGGYLMDGILDPRA